MVVWIRSSEPALGLEGSVISRDDWAHVRSLLDAADDLAQMKAQLQNNAHLRLQQLEVENVERIHARYKRATKLGLRRGVRRGLALAKQAQTVPPELDRDAEQLADIVVTVVQGILLELPVTTRWDLARNRVRHLLGSASSAIVSVHPDDLETARDFFPKMVDSVARLQFIANRSLSRGDLCVDCNRGLLRQDLHWQLEAIRLVLIEHLSDHSDSKASTVLR